ncbi:GNAT family N-acetyltransferase [Acinetobacter sp.]|uniref:peptidogalycan biosysnthesis protein n=1 Tax=Acinetobacter sp. TaxID=472 RepID=UPI003340B774
MHTDLNQLEPQSLVDAFVQHPPEKFEVHHTKDFLPFFITDFNLLTTLDIPVKKKIESTFGYPYWGRLLHLKTCFIGTTVTEYTPLTSTLEIDHFVQKLKNRVNNQSLTIIKDLPINSPLLSTRENIYSQSFVEAAEREGFLSIDGQALAYVPIDFADREDYLSRFSKSRRKNLKRKLKSLDDLRVEILDTGSVQFHDQAFRADLYTLFLNVYHQSEIHFDLLTAEFFDGILQDERNDGKVFLYWKDEILVGYNICFEYQGNLVDKYIGLNYPLAIEYNLYFISWFINLDYAKLHHLKFYIAGWTDPEVKAQLGAKFTFTRHLVWIKQPVLRFILKKLRHLFEADAHWHESIQEPK